MRCLHITHCRIATVKCWIKAWPGDQSSLQPLPPDRRPPGGTTVLRLLRLGSSNSGERRVEILDCSWLDCDLQSSLEVGQQLCDQRARFPLASRPENLQDRPPPSTAPRSEANGEQPSAMLPAAPGAAAGAAAADPAAPADAALAQEPHQLGNVALPPGVAADLLAQAAAAGAAGQQLGGVSSPALFLGANPDSSRLGLGDLCQRFVEQGYSRGASPARLAAVYAFSEREGVPLAEPPPGGRQRRSSPWRGCFPGYQAWTTASTRHRPPSRAKTGATRWGRGSRTAGAGAGRRVPACTRAPGGGGTAPCCAAGGRQPLVRARAQPC